MAGSLHSPFAHTILGTGIGRSGAGTPDARACEEDYGEKSYPQLCLINTCN